MIKLDCSVVERARGGDRDALAEFIRALERPVFALSLRMLASRADAEDAAQEILIRVVTGLGALRDPAAAPAWALRIAVRHLVHTRRRSAIERQRLTFVAFASDLADGLADAPGDMDAEARALAGEVRRGCTLALLTCLTRPLRMAYILGDVFELQDSDAARALGVEAGAYRKRLSRARRAVETFLRGECGLVSSSAACSCARRAPRALSLGRIADTSSETVVRGHADLLRRVSELETAQAAVVLMREDPDFATRAGTLVLELVDRRPPDAA